jgi:hypothetical protein
MSRSYHVVWEIDLDADSPEEAARLAYSYQQNPESTATVFEVTEADSAEVVNLRVDVADDGGFSEAGQHAPGEVCEGRR